MVLDEELSSELSARDAIAKRFHDARLDSFSKSTCPCPSRRTQHTCERKLDHRILTDMLSTQWNYTAVEEMGRGVVENETRASEYVHT